MLKNFLKTHYSLVVFIVFIGVVIFVSVRNTNPVNVPSSSLQGQVLNTTEYITNGGFENTDTSSKPLSWSANGFTVDGSVAHTGTHSLKIVNANLIPYSQSAMQTIGTLPKGVYNIGMWVKMDGVASTVGSGLRINFNTGVYPNACVNGCKSSQIIKGASDWQYLQVQNVTITNDSPAYFVVEMYGDPNGTAWFDDASVMISNTGNTPPPTTTPTNNNPTTPTTTLPTTNIPPVSTPTPPVVVLPDSSLPQCSDGIDNDLDGKIDYPNDPGCSSASDMMEFNAPTPSAPINGLVAGGLMWYPMASLGPNLLLNSGFETLSSGKPANWSGSSAFLVDSSTVHGGASSYSMKDAPSFPYTESARQTLSLKKGSYRISGWIKTNLVDTTIHPCVRISVNAGSAGNGVGKCLNGVNDWTYVELKNVVINQDSSSVKFVLESWNEPAGQAWFDDMAIQEEYQSPMDVFMLYPNYKGFLFDDQSQTIKFDVKINPPAGTTLGDWKPEITLTDESSGSVVANQSYSSSADFTATLSGSSMTNGHTYLARFKLLRSSNSVALYEYPSYRISKVSGSVRNSIPISFNQNNQILFNGQPKFLLGVYDSGGGYSMSETTWENTLTSTKRLFELPVNFWFNYWLGNMPNSAAFPLMNVLQRHGISLVSNANCFSTSTYDDGWLKTFSDADIVARGQYPGFAGQYNMDECVSYLAPDMFTYYNKLRNLDPIGLSFGAGNTPNSMSYWRDTVDLLSMDPYALYGAEPASGYDYSLVANQTKITKDAVQNSRPVATVIQFFKFTSKGRWPTQAELRNMSYMAIAEGSDGLVYWSLGVGALAYICDGSDAAHSPSGSLSWCQAKVDNFNNLKAVTTELNSLQPALSSIDKNDLLSFSSNSSIHTRVKYAGGRGYLIASNNTNATVPVTFTWSTTPSLVSVYGENRNLTVSGNGFTDTFTPYQAHVYEISTGVISAPVPVDIPTPQPVSTPKNGDTTPIPPKPTKPIPSTSTQKYNLGTVTLQKGSAGDAVKELQRYLNDTSKAGLVLDGKFGTTTLSAVMKWQKSHGLLADGVVGEKTKALMYSLVQ
ncbi:peptidoglycan-binding protein [Candidatus Nomurabacteria bacterium]|nr:peptidoglycan-binding protein [Candidatus Nomurabacteria bacterium]